MNDKDTNKTVEKSVTVQLLDNLPKQPPKKNYKLTIFDILIVCTVITPCVVSCWRGVWTLMDLHSNQFPPWESFLFAIIMHIILAASQNVLHHIFIEKRHKYGKFVSFLFAKSYTYVFTVISNLQWRGMWILFDHYLGITVNYKTDDTYKSILIVCVCSILCLMVLRGLKNGLSIPLAVGVDVGDTVFLFPTRFNTNISENFFVYTLDCLFSVFVIGTLVVFVWRGAWVLLDIYVYPHDDITSAWCSLILGYSAIGIAFLLQPLMRWICDRLSGVLRIIIADVYILFALIGTINIWRGIWNLLDHYFLPDRKELGCWITHVGCFGVLVLLGCSNSLLVRGVYIDAEEPAGECVIFPCHYLRVLFQEDDERRRSGGFDVKPVIIEQNQMANMNNTTNHVDNNTIVENSVKHDIVL